MNPTYVMLSGHRVKVQRWQRQPDEIVFSTVIRGEHLGTALAAVTQSERVELDLGDDGLLAGSAKISQLQIRGSGPTAVHRIEITFTPDSVESDSADADPLEQQVQLLRNEVAELRQELRAMKQAQRPSQPAATTIIDFEIPQDDEEETKNRPE